MIAMLIESRYGPDTDFDNEIGVSAEFMGEALKLDGVESFLDLVDRDAGEAVTVVLFRDQAGLEAFGAWAAANEAKAHDAMEYDVVSRRMFAGVTFVTSED